jgi:hypothetical protein
LSKLRVVCWVRSMVVMHTGQHHLSHSLSNICCSVGSIPVAEFPATLHWLCTPISVKFNQSSAA